MAAEIRSELHSCIDAQFTAWLWLNPGAGLACWPMTPVNGISPEHRSRSEPCIVVFGNRPGNFGMNALLSLITRWDLQPSEPEMCSMTGLKLFVQGLSLQRSVSQPKARDSDGLRLSSGGGAYLCWTCCRSQARR